MRRWSPFLIVAGLLALLAGALSPGGRAGIEALSLLFDVWSITRESETAGPPQATITYRGPDGQNRQADLYCDPSSPPGARLLLAHGLVEAGKDDARLRALGHAFARHRFLVVVPDYPGMRALRVGRGDIDEVAASIDAARGISSCSAAGTPAGAPAGSAPRPDPAADLATGVVGFSYSSGPVLLALGRERAARPGDFGVLFGGYGDLIEVVRFLTTGRTRDTGQGGGAEALPEGRWIVLQANADALASPADREALREIGRLRRRSADADIDALARSLSPQGQAVLDLFANTDPARFDALLRHVDPELRATLEALSPARSLRRPLDLDLFLLHGRSDAIVPYTESLGLRRSIRTSGTVRLVLLGGFRHARPQDDRASPVWESALSHPADSARILAILQDVLRRRRDGT
jgi:pimeloyl-ACP methyl ester carboxylesterase